MFFDSSPYPKIPILVNKHRIKFLNEFGDSLSKYNLSYDRSQKAELRTSTNKRLDAAKSMIHLAGIQTTVHQYRMVRDVITNVFAELETSQPEVVFDVVNRAIGVYEHDQKAAWFRTFWPFYWIDLFVDSLARLPFKILGVQNTDIGFIGVIRRIFSFAIWLVTIASSAFGILDFFGMKPMVLKLLGYK